MKTTQRISIIASLLLLAAPSLYADPLSFIVVPEQSEVTFLSVAPLESFTGTTNQLSGTMKLDPADLATGISGQLTVNMADLSTGSAIRDDHMRKNHLQTERYPESQFTPKFLKSGPDSLVADVSQSFILGGIFTLHGVSKQILVDVEAIWHPTTSSIEVTAKFPVRLADYNISRPQFLTMKLGEVQQVTVTFSATSR